MFDPWPVARVFALPPGVDFPKALVHGLVERFAEKPPEALAQVHLIVNTSRMARRIRELFDAGPARLLPRVSLLTEVDRHIAATDLPPRMPPLRRRLQLAQLISHLLDREPDLAARSSIYSLADSLAGLMDEMQGEGVPADVICGLDVSDMSGHWARAQRFFKIAETYLHDLDGQTMDSQARMRQAVIGLIASWQKAPPANPIILAGSTGSRGTTAMLMAQIARLPQGAIILPGYDFDQPESVWAGLDSALHSEDHPQYRFKRLMQMMGVGPSDIHPWTDARPHSPARNRLISLSLRPAPVTNAWLTEGPGLRDLDRATQDVTLVQAPDPRSEALAIALRLRQAAETGQTAALITPDRMLTRQVAAALDRWDILPDDSAGLPLQLSPPGRFLRHVAGLFAHRLTGEMLLTLLKHPLCHAGDGRNTHMLHSRDLELRLRRHGPPFPAAQSLGDACSSLSSLPPQTWIDWLTMQFCARDTTAALPLTDWAAMLRQTAETLSAGSCAAGSGTLWEKNAGQKALAVLDDLDSEARNGGTMNARDFADLLGALLSSEEVRDRDAPHERIMIWGTLEARVQGADLLILGGLNEGSWPEAPDPDPWLNRALRDRAGLLLPERRIGLAAHDFQQAANAPEVWLTRAQRSDDAETVPSRWLNRLMNLLNGLPDQNGPDLLRGMQTRGQIWLDWAAELDAVDESRPAIRPSPRPPVAARPRRLSVTEIKKLIRDPYAIYARHVLRLKPLDPLVKAPDPLLRGIVVHDFLEEFIKASVAQPEILTRSAFLEMADQVLARSVPWPATRRLWLARLDRVASSFLENERDRQSVAMPVEYEAGLDFQLAPLDFKLVGRADRIDRDTAGALRIYDYKTGAPPSKAEQALFDKQLLIEAAVAEEGGFAKLGPTPVAAAEFIRVGAPGNDVPAPLDSEPTAKVLAELRRLIAAYFDPEQGFTARRMLQKDTDVSDYDQLARFGEWDRTTIPIPEDLT
ncbi:double-strand break repair protein AddB [Sedimentitalea nanhaiensis]|uniref:Double-strand break repair protein AddB n=1 Tax=Sedimentitalea nanhaiensis TaxID=999627 RepID=A0A1I7CB50_9RHOB|nr:double-strand break repair protein AddB [Sedimentitalea nanhaiensis]SFT96642.1 double-strand break repair protein AddB [Sedimentitalea nanhaiensis]